MPHVSAFLLKDEQSAIIEPLGDLGTQLKGKVSKRLFDLITDISDTETGWGLWRSKSSVDAGAWFVFPKCFVLCTEQSLHLLADAPSWLGGKIVHRYIELDSVQRAQFNDVTAHLALQLDSPDKEWPALQLDPIDGHQAVLLIERLIT